MATQASVSNLSSRDAAIRGASVGTDLRSSERKGARQCLILFESHLRHPTVLRPKGAAYPSFRGASVLCVCSSKRGKKNQAYIAPWNASLCHSVSLPLKPSDQLLF